MTEALTFIVSLILIGLVLRRTLQKHCATMKMTEKAKKEWEHTFDAVPDLMAILDTDHRILRINRAFSERLGKEPKECIGLRCYECVDGRSAPPDCCPHTRTLREGKEQTVEIRYGCLKGDFLVTTSPLRDDQGQIVASVHVARDVTKRKQAERSLWESEQRYRRIFENAAEGIFQILPDGRCLNVNPAFAHMFGFEHADEMLREVDDISRRLCANPKDFAKLVKLVEEYGSVKDMEMEFKHRAGHGIWISINANAVRGQDEGIVHLEGTADDVTDRRRAEAALQKRLMELRCLSSIAALMERPRGSLPEVLQGIVSLIPRALQYPEAAAARILLEDGDYRSAHFLETPWKMETDILIGGRRRGALQVCYLREVPATAEHAFVKEERTLIDIIAQRVGNLVEYRRAEEQVRNALAEKEVLLREVHHRVKNNLQGIIHLISSKEDRISDGKVRQLLKELQAQARTMSLVYEQLYQSEDLARVEMESYLQDLAANVLQTFGGDRDIRLAVDAAKVTMDVETAMPCGLIVNELITNCMKYAFPPDRREQGHIQVGLRVEEGSYVLTVSDDGIGLPKGRDLQKSDSLGLKLVNLWATHQLGGHLDVTNGKGTAFTVRFRERASEGHKHG